MKYGRYQIVRELGSGTMGVVYEAYDPQIDRTVALKVLRPDRVSNEAFRVRFLKEARAIGRLSDPHIVTIYDVGEDHGTIYIAMEYLKGEAFDTVIRSGRLAVANCIDIARQVALTLDYAHKRGIVHRDIKPSNIILTKANQIKLTDFGIARIEDAAAALQTQAGEILGTPVYMSPEQIKGEAVDGRSDLFSLGVILYEMIVGRRPFGGNNIVAIFKAIAQAAPEAPAQLDPFVPKSLSDLIMTSLARSPAERFQNGHQMAEALKTVSGEMASDLAQNAVPAPRKRFGMTAALVLVVLLVLGTGGYLFFYAKAQSSGQKDLTEHPARVNQPAVERSTILSRKRSAALVADRKAILKITTEPQGAQVFVDKGYKGITPMDLSLPVGKYELRLNMPGYFEWEAQVELDAEGETPLHIPLRALPE